jgi:hypothetical protein
MSSGWPQLYAAKKLIGFDEGTLGVIEEWRGGRAIRVLVTLGASAGQADRPQGQGEW